jgi:Zn-dependent peptidase ImmA (M78 family)
MKTLLDVLHERRKILQNPYAFVDELAELENVRQDRFRLENPYAHIDQISAGAQPIQRFDGIAELVRRPEGAHRARRRTELELEIIVRDVQLGLWNNRRALFGTEDLDPIDVLDPAVALRARGYQVIEVESLGQFAASDGVFEVAGSIDRDRNRIHVSTQFSRAIQGFTLAHELGHALLHEATGLHRDRALDGSSSSRDPDEREANRFGTLFLMPSKQVRRVFEESFGLTRVRVDERATFRGKIPKKANIRRMAARRIASMGQYNGVSFVPLAERFHVSLEAMAIRLEELELFILSNNLSRRHT